MFLVVALLLKFILQLRFPRNDIFYLVSDSEFCSNADEMTLYDGEKTLTTVLTKLEKDTLLLFQRFSNYLMKLIKGQCHRLIFGARDKGVTSNV